MHAANDDVEDNPVRAELTRPLAILLDPDVHERAQTWADDPAGYAGSITTREPISHVAGLYFDDQVHPTADVQTSPGLAGLPSLSGLPSR